MKKEKKRKKKRILIGNYISLSHDFNGNCKCLEKSPSALTLPVPRSNLA